MSAPAMILDLVARFERNLAAYKSGSYNETQVRREFLDPFFEALGWDVNNRQRLGRALLVYGLYGLTAEEIAIVEGCA